MNTKILTKTALLSSIAIICGYIENLLPPLTQIPGIKLGISNIVILFVLYTIGGRYAFFTMLIKVLVSSLLFSGLNVLIYSFAGGILSLLGMVLLKDKLSIIGVSMLGAVLHNTGQITAAALILKTTSIFCYLYILLISGLVLGFLTGTVCRILIKRNDIN